MAKHAGPRLPLIVKNLLPVLNSVYDIQRITTTAFFAEVGAARGLAARGRAGHGCWGWRHCPETRSGRLSGPPAPALKGLAWKSRGASNSERIAARARTQSSLRTTLKNEVTQVLSPRRAAPGPADCNPISPRIPP